MLSDEELMIAVARGEHDAFRSLYDRHQGGVFRFIARYLARAAGNRDVDDVFQETWVRVARHAGRFDPSRRFTTWLFQIAVNLCRDWHRRQRPTEDVGDARAPGDGPAAREAAQEAAIDADRLLARLPEAQRAVLVLRYYHDLSEAEIAGILDIPPGTVKSRAHAAVERLRVLVEMQA
jgi:RNA polymerase sigma-70 factor (ECF subfamily)